MELAEEQFFARSEYLTNIEKRYPEVRSLSTSSLDSLRARRDEIDTIDVSDLDKAKKSLCKAKAIFDYHWCLFRLKDVESAVELGRIRAEFADATLNKALLAAWQSPEICRFLSREYKNKVGLDIVPGLFVLGLGKLGGYDLNFSSDIDLIAFYDPQVIPVSVTQGRTDVCTRVLKRMSQILSSQIDGEFVWRVDWRLRPDASVAPIVMSTDAAEDFYFFRSLPWHRLALIKARVVAGDLAVGGEFLRRLESYIWRQNLDYSIVDEVRFLKDKINQEHPQLRLARAQEDPESSEQHFASSKLLGDGFNLKLGKGGIREIEFLCNTLQLLWGGKKPELRAAETVKVLEALSDVQLIESQTAAELQKHYLQLRLVEDAIQIRENLQTHAWPPSEQAQHEVQKLLEYPSLEELKQTLADARSYVHNEYDHFFRLLGAHASDVTSNSLDPRNLNWFDRLSVMAKSILQGWEDGFLPYALPTRSAPAMGTFLDHLLRIVDQSPGDKEEKILALHSFFRSIPSGGQYIRLLAEHPLKLNDIVEPLLNAPPMSELLTQSPHIVEYLFEAEPVSETEFNSDFVIVSTDFETRLQRFRRFVNEQLYRLMLDLFRGRIVAEALQEKLTLLAEYCLKLGLEIVTEDMDLDGPPIAIMSMGKLGMRAMAPLSDLDLIFFAEEGVDLELATRFSNRFRHLLDVRTSEGRAYEMDMRLRPSGRSGPATVSLSSYEDYQLTKAKTWEHIALVAARPVSGSAEAVRSLADIRASVLAKPRQGRQFLMDAKKMHARVRNQRISQPGDERLNVKLRPGGLFEADYLSACMVILARASESELQLPYDDLVKTVSTNTYNSNLMESVGFWRNLLIWSRIFGLEDMKPDSLTADQLELICADLGCESYGDLASEMRCQSAFVKDSLAALFSELKIAENEYLEDWEELNVSWED